MLTNVLVLVVLVVAVYFIAKEEKTNLQNWLYKDWTPEKAAMVKVFDFWKEVCKKPARIVALAVTLICQKSVWGMLVSAIILLGVTYYLAAKMDVLQKIEWEKDETQKIATLATVCLALCWLLDKVELFRVVYNILIVGVLVVGGISLVWLLFFSDRHKTREADVIEYDDVEDPDEAGEEAADAEGEPIEVTGEVVDGEEGSDNE